MGAEVGPSLLASASCALALVSASIGAAGCGGRSALGVDGQWGPDATIQGIDADAPGVADVRDSGRDGRGNSDATTQSSSGGPAPGDGGSSSSSSSGGSSASSSGGYGDAGADAESSSSSSGAGGGSSSGSGSIDAGMDGIADGGEAAPASCALAGPGRSNCRSGDGGIESCCTSLEVTGGTFYRTYTPTDAGPTMEADPATISSFRLDKYLVTVGRFRQFVKAWNGGSGYAPPAGSGKHTYLNGGRGLVNAESEGGIAYETGWDSSNDFWLQPTDSALACNCQSCPPNSTWTSTPGDQENLPINCVTWWEAYAFCIWDGGFLPSEAEWRYAAVGGSAQRQYPWGSTDPGTSSQYAIYGCLYPDGDRSACPGDGGQHIAPVGTAVLGAGLWGQLDMAGEVTEWNLDSSQGYFGSPYVTPCTDCANLAGDGFSDRMCLGGCFFAPPFDLSRSAPVPGTRGDAIGFRCARTP